MGDELTGEDISKILINLFSANPDSGSFSVVKWLSDQVSAVTDYFGSFDLFAPLTESGFQARTAEIGRRLMSFIDTTTKDLTNYIGNLIYKLIDPSNFDLTGNLDIPALLDEQEAIVVDSIRRFVKDIGDTFTSVTDSAIEELQKVPGKIKDIGLAIWNDVAFEFEKGFMEIGNWIKKIPQMLQLVIAENIPDTLRSVADSLGINIATPTDARDKLTALDTKLEEDIQALRRKYRLNEAERQDVEVEEIERSSSSQNGLGGRGGVNFNTSAPTDSSDRRTFNRTEYNTTNTFNTIAPPAAPGYLR